MSKLDKIWTDIKHLTNDAQVLKYWEKWQSRILKNVQELRSEAEAVTAISILHKFAKSLNDREKYASVYYLYQVGFRSIEKQLKASDALNELKFELGRGLHHNRKYEQAKELFNALASSGFDLSRIDGWWDQTAFASVRDRVWLTADLLPTIAQLLMTIAYILIAIKTQAFIITTTIFIILSELFEVWWYQYRVVSYLKEFENRAEVIELKKGIKKKIWIELGITLLVYPIYLLRPEYAVPLVIIIAVYFQLYHYGLNYHYLPKLIADLNRKKSKT